MNARKKLREFGVVLAIILFLIGIINLFKNNIYPATILYILDFFIIIVIVANPILLNPVYRVLIFVSHIIGWINTKLLLGIIYYLVFTPIGIVLRILRKDPLGRRFDREKESYWILRDESYDPTRCENQY